MAATTWAVAAAAGGGEGYLFAGGGVGDYSWVGRLKVGVDLAADPVLKRFKSALQDMYGDQIDRLILFGSRARGDARPDFDYDIAVFLKSATSTWKQRQRLAIRRRSGTSLFPGALV